MKKARFPMELCVNLQNFSEGQIGEIRQRLLELDRTIGEQLETLGTIGHNRAELSVGERDTLARVGREVISAQRRLNNALSPASLERSTRRLERDIGSRANTLNRGRRSRRVQSAN